MNSDKLRPDEKLQFPLIIVNYDSGLNVIKANSKALELFGQSLKSLKDLVDKPESPIFIDEEGKPLTLEMLPEYQVLEKGKSIENQIVGVFSQSSLKYSWFEVSISPQTMHNNQCTEIRAIYKEIPEFFNRNNSLINTKRRYQRVLENIDNLVFQFLFVPEFKINYISSNVHHFYGYNADEFYKNPSLIKEVIHPDDLNLLALSRDEKFENDKTVRFRLVGRDAQIIWVDGVFYPEINENGQLVSLEGIVQNITDDILAKDELERKQNLIDSILYNLEGFAYRCNYSQNCEITYISEHIEKLTGYKISDFNINKTISLRDLIFEDDRDFVKGKIDSAVKENQPGALSTG